jgi:hypothetical protein
MRMLSKYVSAAPGVAGEQVNHRQHNDEKQKRVHGDTEDDRHRCDEKGHQDVE